jgi:predicted transcriptional regulator
MMLLSIHPRHVKAILAGTKTIELRRTRPVIDVGQPVAIYATMPLGALVATCRIASIEADSPTRLWTQVKDHANISKVEYDDYFADTDTAVALYLDRVTPLVGEITLAHLRQQGQFHPPQTWHFLDHTRLRHLVGGHPSLASLTSLLVADVAV